MIQFEDTPSGPCFFFDIPRNTKQLATNYRQEATHKKIRKHKPRTRRKEHSKWRESKQFKQDEKCGKTRITEQSPKVLAFKPAVFDACFLQLGMTVASWQENLKSSILPRFLQVQLKSIDDTTKGGACGDGFTFGVWKVGFWIIKNLQLKVALLRCHVWDDMKWINKIRWCRT